MGDALVRRSPRSLAWAYLLWLPGLVALPGIHRLYTGRTVSGIVWLLTGGLCGIGQLIDLFFIPRMVDDYNHGRDVW